MKSSWRTFALAALVGSGLLLLSQTTVHAQFRRAPIAPALPILPPAPRAPMTTPPSIVPYTYTNPLLVQQNLYLQNLATQNALYTQRALLLQYQLYNPLYNPYRVGYPTVGYPIYPAISPALLYNAGFINPGLPYNPNNLYNPYFAAFGFRP